MKKEGLAWTLFGGFGAGALTMYFADPNRGKRSARDPERCVRAFWS